MDQQQNQANPNPKLNNSLIIISAVIITAVIVGGGAYWWHKEIIEEEKGALEKKIEDLERMVTLLDEEIISLRGIDSEQSSEDRDIQRMSDINQINLALEMYYGDNGRYPVSESLDKVVGSSSILIKALSPDYLRYAESSSLNGFPLDPLNPERWYSYISDGKSFKLYFYPETQNPETLYRLESKGFFSNIKIEFSDDKYLIIRESL